MRIPFRGAVVLITGGASGIGRLMALGAAKRGAARVIIWDRNVEAAQSVADEITECRAYAIEADVSNNARVREAADETFMLVDRVDILIHSAGIVTGKSFLELTEADIHRTFQVNALSLYRVTRQFLPKMIEQNKGSITTIASAAGLIGVSRQTDYSASKFAATGFVESLRAELREGRHSIHTLLVQPFYINTGMFDGVTTKVPALLPLLEQEDVAKRILDAIEKGHQSLVLPRAVALVKLLKALPVPVFDKIADVFDVNESMETFVGRQ